MTASEPPEIDVYLSLLGVLGDVDAKAAVAKLMREQRLTYARAARTVQATLETHTPTTGPFERLAKGVTLGHRH